MAEEAGVSGSGKGTVGRGGRGDPVTASLDALFDAYGTRPVQDDGLSPAAREVAAAFARLSDDERMAVMGEYCRECGSDDPRCVCWRDE